MRLVAGTLIALSFLATHAVRSAPAKSRNFRYWMNLFRSRPLIENPSAEITFHLYTRDNRDAAHQIWVGNLNNSTFNASKPTRFTVHGYNDDGFTSWIEDTRDNFLDEEDCNVILVDWAGPGSGPLYNVAKTNAEPTGRYIWEMYAFLNSRGLKWEDMHCIGHSLGAHVCGFSGKASSGALGRITGLDPALVLFSFYDPTSRLADTDASFVDVIHTCGGWMGFEKPIGHADFYPNGGSPSQPGCGIDITCDCSHARSAELFVESVVSSNFAAKQCDSWTNYQNGTCNANPTALMGYPCSENSIGKFFLETAGDSPYAIGYSYK